MSDLASTLARLTLEEKKKTLRLLNKLILSEVSTVEETQLSFIEENGIISFSLQCLGLSPNDWVRRFRKRGRSISHGTANTLRWISTQCLDEDELLSVRIIKSDALSGKNTVEYLEEFASERNFLAPSPFIVCEIANLITDKHLESMGLQHLHVMHAPVPLSEKFEQRFVISSQSFCRQVDGDRTRAFTGSACPSFRANVGFVYVSS